MKWITLLVFVALVACTPSQSGSQPTAAVSSSSPRTLTVFAASSLTNAFTEIGAAFEAAHPGVKVNFNFAGSQTLRAQIMDHAPADVIAPASAMDIQALSGLGFLSSSPTPATFGANKMIVILAPGNPGNLQSLQDLARPGLKLILAAEPVPAGKYARSMLKNLNQQYGEGFNQKVLANVVSNEENVRQVVSKVQLGEADAGIVYASDAAATPELPTLIIPNDLNEVATYQIAVIHDSPNADLAGQFIDYVLSADGQATLRKWGFLPPQ